MANIRNFNNAAHNNAKNLVGLLVDDGAPYSGMGIGKFKLLLTNFSAYWN